MKTTGFAEAEGARLYFEREGRGPAVLFIHAGVADLRMWDDQVKALSGQFECLRFDMRGFGRTENKVEAFSHVSDVVAVLDQADVEQAHVVGLSMGGSVAVDFTLENARRVRSLVLVASGVGGFHYQNNGEENSAFEEMDRKAHEEAWDELVELELQMWLDGPGRAGRIKGEPREKLRVMCRGGYERNEPEATTIATEPPAAQRLSSLKVPTVVVCGTYDTRALQAASEFLEREIPGAEKLDYEGVAHMVNLEQPERFNNDLLTFLGSQR